MSARRCRAALAAVLFALGAGACRQAPSPTGANEKPGAARLPDLGIGGDFRLTAQDGRPFRLADLRGKIVLLFFGYTSCPDICPMTLGTVARVEQQLGEQAAAEIVPLFVSVDPTRDTPAVLAEYLAHFRIGAVGLTGSKQEIDAVVKLFRAHYEVDSTDSAMGALITHTAYLFLIDRQGRVRHLFHPNEPPESIVEVLRQVL